MAMGLTAMGARAMAGHMRRYRHTGRRLRRNRRGSVMTEVAFTLPLLLILFAGGFEIGRYALLQMKVSRAATMIADLVAQNEKTISTDDIEGFLEAVPHVGRPFRFDNGTTQVIVTGVKADGTDTPVVCWQVDEMAALGNNSEIGSTGGVATLPQNLPMIAGDTAIIAEIYYAYTPSIFSGFVDSGTLRSSAIYRPRLAMLDVLEPSGQTCP